MGKHHHRHTYIARTFAALTAVVTKTHGPVRLATSTPRDHRDTHIHTGRYIYIYIPAEVEAKEDKG